MAAGAKRARPDVDVDVCPMADGGEGTAAAVAAAAGGEMIDEVVCGPLPGQSVAAQWAYLPRGVPGPSHGMEELDGFLDPGVPTAVIEMAQASGLALVPEGSRDPTKTSTLGTGELIRLALDAGCRQVIVGIGGSGTVDGGTGMAAALGCRFLDRDGRELAAVGGSMEKIDIIDTSGLDTRLRQTGFLVASDVDSPLVGESGAARVFGPQKGAGPAQVEALERGLGKLAQAISVSLGTDVLEVPGAGAAGGLGAGLVAFCGARITSGAMLVAGMARLGERVGRADLVLTGEGSYDSQTVRGKVPAAVIEIARRHGVPVVVIAGTLAGDRGESLGGGAAAYCPLPGPMELSAAMDGAAEHLESGTCRLLRLLVLMQEG